MLGGLWGSRSVRKAVVVEGKGKDEIESSGEQGVFEPILNPKLPQQLQPLHSVLSDGFLPNGGVTVVRGTLGFKIGSKGW